MKEAIIIMFGLLVGFDLALGVAWWTLRQANRHSVGLSDRVRPYVGQRKWPW